MQALFYKKYHFLKSSFPPAKNIPSSGGASHKLPPLCHITPAKNTELTSAVKMPDTLAARSPAVGPVTQLTSAYTAFPPSSGRRGSKLNAPSTRCAPAATQNRSPNRDSTNPVTRFTAGPARIAASSPPYPNVSRGAYSSAPNTLSFSVVNRIPSRRSTIQCPASWATAAVKTAPSTHGPLIYPNHRMSSQKPPVTCIRGLCTGHIINGV